MSPTNRGGQTKIILSYWMSERIIQSVVVVVVGTADDPEDHPNLWGWG